MAVNPSHKKAFNKESGHKEAGFSRIKILCVLALLSLTAGLVFINLSKPAPTIEDEIKEDEVKFETEVKTVSPHLNKARVVRAKGDIAIFETALEFYQLDKSSYPSEQDGLEALASNVYIKELKPDPWGNPYEYRNPGERSTVDVFSLGADGKPGGEGLDADIGNWR